MKNNFHLRLVTGLILVFIMIPTIYLPEAALKTFLLVGILISFFELFEVGRAVLHLKYYHFVIPIAFIFTQYLTSYFLNSTFSLLLGIAFVALCMYCVLDTKMEIPAFVYILFVLLYTGLTFEAMSFIRHQSANYILFLFVAVFATDTGAYFIGKRFGKHKLAIHLSPKKTIEGALGGIVSGTLLASLCMLFLQLIPAFRLGVKPSILFVFIALLLSVSSEFGDLFASKIKRFFQKKDFGFIFPGHGGIIDRVDGLVLASIILYVVLHFA